MVFQIPTTAQHSLGELSGNKFSVVVRGAMVPRAAVKSSLKETCSNGFINFFGTQRVGSPLAASRGQPLPYQARVPTVFFISGKQFSFVKAPDETLHEWLTRGLSYFFVAIVPFFCFFSREMVSGLGCCLARALNSAAPTFLGISFVSLTERIEVG